jgi:hypothetical protein
LDIQGLPHQNLYLTGGVVLITDLTRIHFGKLDNIQFKRDEKRFLGKVGLTYDINDKKCLLDIVGVLIPIQQS